MFLLRILPRQILRAASITVYFYQPNTTLTLTILTRETSENSSYLSKEKYSYDIKIEVHSYVNFLIIRQKLWGGIKFYSSFIYHLYDAQHDTTNRMTEQSCTVRCVHNQYLQATHMYRTLQLIVPRHDTLRTVQVRHRMYVSVTQILTFRFSKTGNLRLKQYQYLGT